MISIHMYNSPWIDHFLIWSRSYAHSACITLINDLAHLGSITLLYDQDHVHSACITLINDLTHLGTITPSYDQDHMSIHWFLYNSPWIDHSLWWLGSDVHSCCIILIKSVFKAGPINGFNWNRKAHNQLK